MVRDTPGCLYLDTGVAAAAADDDNTTTWLVCLLLLQDTVAVQELRFGDNDTLSAQVRVQAPLGGGGGQGDEAGLCDAAAGGSSSSNRTQSVRVGHSPLAEVWNPCSVHTHS